MSPAEMVAIPALIATASFVAAWLVYKLPVGDELCDPECTNCKHYRAKRRADRERQRAEARERSERFARERNIPTRKDPDGKD